MSPGATFERVYRELKRRLATAELPPGTPLEPTQLGQQLAASITPVRDALHRLVGELLVDAPGHNGFRVPRPSEAELRDLYIWNGRVVALATTGMRTTGALRPAPPNGPVDELPAAVAQLFERIATHAQSGEHVRAVMRLNDRLAVFREAEMRALDGIFEEYAALESAFAAGDQVGLRSTLTRYHRRRARAAPKILASVA